MDIVSLIVGISAVGWSIDMFISEFNYRKIKTKDSDFTYSYAITIFSIIAFILCIILIIQGV